MGSYEYHIINLEKCKVFNPKVGEADRKKKESKHDGGGIVIPL